MLTDFNQCLNKENNRYQNLNVPLGGAVLSTAPHARKGGNNFYGLDLLCVFFALAGMEQFLYRLVSNVRQ